MKRPAGILLIAMSAVLALAGVAVAQEAIDEEPEAVMPVPVVVVDEEAATVSIALPLEDGELPECGEPDDPEVPEVPDEDASLDEDPENMTYGPGSCIELVIDHPSGKTHHGAVVSTVAKGVHPSMLDGIKKGEIMRWVAKGGSVEDGLPVPAAPAGQAEKAKPDRGPKDKPNKGKAKGKNKQPGD